MYKKKELIAMLEACRKYPQIETSQLEDKLRSAIKTKRRPRLNSKNKNALMDIYNAGVEDPAKKAIEEIFNIIRFDEAYKEIGICSEDDFWEAVYENSKELKSDTYGFYSNRAAFEKDGIPANVFLWNVEENILCIQVMNLTVRNAVAWGCNLSNTVCLKHMRQQMNITKL